MRNFFLLLFCLPSLAFANANVLVYNSTNQTIVNGELSNTPEVSIASISKLLTVYTVLNAKQDLNQKLIMEKARTKSGAEVTRIDLIKLALVASDNAAARTLGENFPGGISMFVTRMNENAKLLGMTHSRFVEPTGLSPMNFSTVQDVMLLTNAASNFSIVSEAAQTKQTTAESIQGNKSVKITGNSTIKFFGTEGIVAIKTGFTKAAGFCVTMLVTAHDQRYNIVVLGAKTKQERMMLVEQSLKTIYSL